MKTFKSFLKEQIVVTRLKFDSVTSIEEAHRILSENEIKFTSEETGRSDESNGITNWRNGSKIVASWSWKSATPGSDQKSGVLYIYT